MPLLPASLIEPLWVEFAALIESDRPEFDPTHPWGCHRRRIPDNQGIPLHLVAARANDHDSPLLEPTLAGIVDMIGPLPQHRGVHGEDLFPTVHLDRGYDSGKTRNLLEVLGFTGEIAIKGVPAPIQAGPRWPVERTHSWVNGYGKRPPVHRQAQGHRRVLPAPRRRPDRHPSADQPGPHPLSLANPAHHPPRARRCGSSSCLVGSG